MEDFVFVAVVGARFLVPLFIPRFTLPAILAALVLDAVDQTAFAAFNALAKLSGRASFSPVVWRRTKSSLLVAKGEPALHVICI